MIEAVISAVPLRMRQKRTAAAGDVDKVTMHSSLKLNWKCELIFTLRFQFNICQEWATFFNSRFIYLHWVNGQEETAANGAVANYR